MNARESKLKAGEDKSVEAAPATGKLAEIDMRHELSEQKKQMKAQLGENNNQETTEEVNKLAEKSKSIAGQGGELNGQGRSSASVDAPDQGN